MLRKEGERASKEKHKAIIFLQTEAGESYYLWLRFSVFVLKELGQVNVKHFDGHCDLKKFWMQKFIQLKNKHLYQMIRCTQIPNIQSHM